MLGESRSAVRSEFARVVEETAFTMVEPLEQDPAPGSAELTRVVTVNFVGPSSGRIVLYCPSGFSTHLARAMLGLDGEVPDGHQAADAARELLTVVAGNLLTTIYGTEGEFALSMPMVDDDEHKRLIPERALFFDVDGFLVALSIEGGRDG